MGNRAALPSKSKNYKNLLYLLSPPASQLAAHRYHLG